MKEDYFKLCSLRDSNLQLLLQILLDRMSAATILFLFFYVTSYTFVWSKDGVVLCTNKVAYSSRRFSVVLSRGKTQWSGRTEEALHSLHKLESRLSGSGCSFRTHAVPEHVDEGGVELAAGMMVHGESLALLCHLQSLDPLSA